MVSLLETPLHRIIGSVIYLIISALLVPTLWLLVSKYYGRTAGVVFFVASMFGVAYIILRELLLLS